MVKELSKEPSAYQWALPENVAVPADALKVRLDFYTQSVVMYLIDNHIITSRMVSPQDIALALLKDIPLGSGLLPENALWWQHRGDGAPIIALWRTPKIWPAALQLEPFKPPRRFKLPMPGLIFLCRPGSPPIVVAAKKRPTTSEMPIYRAPVYNLYANGSTCPGSHNYTSDISKIPEEFFTAFFTKSLEQNVSKKYGSDLLKLWESVDGKKRYPLGDLIQIGKIVDLLR